MMTQEEYVNEVLAGIRQGKTIKEVAEELVSRLPPGDGVKVAEGRWAPAVQGDRLRRTGGRRALGGTPLGAEQGDRGQAFGQERLRVRIPVIPDNGSGRKRTWFRSKADKPGDWRC